MKLRNTDVNETKQGGTVLVLNGMYVDGHNLYPETQEIILADKEYCW